MIATDNIIIGRFPNHVPMKKVKQQSLADIIYHEVGDYLLPNIALTPTDTPPLTKYGMMRKAFLKQHQPTTYALMSSAETLYPHCYEIELSAIARMEHLMSLLPISDPPPVKEIDPMAWATHMMSLHHTAEETILQELIYSL
jgi:hypothetical protein